MRVHGRIAVALAIAGVVSLSGCAASAPQTGSVSEATPESSAPAEPTSSIRTPAEVAESVRLNVSDFSSPEEVVETFINDKLGELTNSTGGTEVVDAWFEAGAPEDYEFNIEYVTPYSTAAADVWFSEGWKDNANLYSAFEDIIVSQAQTQNFNILTTDSGNEEDKEPYASDWELIENHITDATENSFTSTIVYKYADNALENKIHSYPDTNYTGSYAPMPPETIHWVKSSSGDSWVIADWVNKYSNRK